MEYKENNKKGIGDDNSSSFERKGDVMKTKETAAKRLFECKINIAPEEIKAIGDFPLLETLMILKSPDKESAEKAKKMMFKELANSILNKVQADPDKVQGEWLKLYFSDTKKDSSQEDIKDFQESLSKVFENGVKKGILELNERTLEDAELVLGYKSLDEFPPKKQEELELMRTLSRTIIEDKDLLDRCIKPWPDCGWSLKEYLPALVKDAALKARLNLKNDQIEKFADNFVNIQSLKPGYPNKEGEAILWYFDKDDPWYQNDWERRNIYGILCEYANSYFQSEYFAEQLYKVKEVIKLYYPEIFIDLPIRVKGVKEKLVRGAFEATSIFLGSPLLIKESSIPLNNRRDYGEMEVFDSYDAARNLESKPAKRVLKKNKDFIDFSHEYFHRLFAKITNFSPNWYENDEYRKKHLKSPYDTLLEGSGTFFEMLTTDFMIKDAEKLGLSARDMEDLNRLKKNQIALLTKHGREIRHSNREMEVIENPKERKLYIEKWSAQLEDLLRRKPEKLPIRDYSELPKIKILEDRISFFKGLENDELRENYLKSLRDEILRYNIYFEGTLKFMHKLYKKEGLLGCMNFIKNLDIEKILNVDRESEEYKELLNNPDLFVKKFTK